MSPGLIFWGHFFMPLKAKDRAHAGYRQEDGTAKSRTRKGHNVKKKDRNAKYDMEVDGKKVEVKSAIKTKYKGSDGHPVEGYVFSNMKKNPKSDKHILKCLSPDRKRVVKKYEIPSDKIKQKTLTITDNGKYEKFKKTASLLDLDARKLKYQTLGGIGGAVMLAGADTTIEYGRYGLGLDYREEDVNFFNTGKVLGGMAAGQSIARAVEQKTRRRHDRATEQERTRPRSRKPRRRR